MKKVCPKCGSNNLHKHGKKRRKCVDCGATCTIQSGRRRTCFSDMYLLDRSTMRRIGTKEHMSAVGVMKHVMKELKVLPQPLDDTKNFTQM